MSIPRLASRDTPQGAIAQLEAALREPRVVIERPSPCVEGGRYAAKAVVGQTVAVEADIFTDGHDELAAELVWWSVGQAPERVPLRPLGNDRWRAEFTPRTTGPHRYLIEAWIDRWQTYRTELGKKAAAGVPTPLEVEEGRRLVREVATQAARTEASAALALLRRLDPLDDAAARTLLLADATAATLRAVEQRRHVARTAELAVDVERLQAGFASWYELFPRSQTRDPGRHGTFDDVIARLPAIRAMGFDVLYFPPIHPIGTSHRKGRNNALHAAPGDVGSCYAIGGPEGGHDAVHPELGGIDGFRRLQAAAADHGLELALDIAIQFSPDHPWLTRHPDWFPRRPDGSVRYAENPPKKYEDICNVDFYTEQGRAQLWASLRGIIDYWVGEGVRTFRVDNPHTKPFPFWEWLITDVRSRHPDVIFLSEAFTRPARMYRLAKLGFAQSYTYFTWRHTKAELTEYLRELTEGPPKDFFRPHFFVNTPDINPYFLQTSGRPGFLIRAALATTLSGLWGMYSGFEICESAPLPGKEEYLDSEKYQIRVRDWNAPGNIVAEITRLNHIRRQNPALQTHLGVRFYTAWNDQVLFYGKSTPDRSNVVLVAVSLDPHRPQDAHLEVPLWEFGLPDQGALTVEELMSGERFTWHGKMQHWRFTAERPFAIWRVSAPA